MARRLLIVAALAVLALPASLACDDGGDGSVTVFAAASLEEAFEDMVDDYPYGDVRFNFAGSQVLRVQLENGAEADVFASADERQMALAVEAGLVGEPSTLASNTLVIAIGSDVASIDDVMDLANPGLRLVLAAPEVPAGRYARTAIAALAEDLGDRYEASVLDNVVSNEEDVRRVLTKVLLGEADAGIVYASDVEAANADVRSLPIPRSAQPAIRYSIAPATGGDGEEARRFIDFALGDEGREALAAHGLQPP